MNEIFVHVKRCPSSRLSGNSPCGRIRPMDAIQQIWESVRERIHAEMSERGWSGRALALRAGIPPTTLASFLRGDAATLGDDKMAALEKEIGQLIPGGVAVAPSRKMDLRLIPVVDLASLRLTDESGSSEEAVVGRIHRAAQDWIETERPEPGLFAVRVGAESWGRFKEGDKVLVSPGSKASGGDFVVAICRSGLELCRLLDSEAGGEIVETSPGKTEKPEKIIGRAVEHRSLL